MKRIIQLVVTITALAAMSTAQAIVVLEGGPNGAYSNAQNINAAFSYIPDQTIEINSGFDLGIPNASVFGFSGDGTYDYYSFDVGNGLSPLQTGQAVYFDTDFAQVTGLDTQLTLFNTNGTSMLASNDDALFDGPGDLAAMTTNSFLSFTFKTAGLYYIRVSQADHHNSLGGKLFADATYRLNVSTIPIPAAAWLFGTGLIALFALSKRRKAAIA